MEELFVVLLLVSLITITLGFAIMVYNLVTWINKRKQWKYTKKYPEIAASCREYNRRLDEHCAEWNKIVPILKNEIKKFENEKMYLPVDILKQREQEVEEKKKILYSAEMRLNAEYEELSRMREELEKAPKK